MPGAIQDKGFMSVNQLGAVSLSDVASTFIDNFGKYYVLSSGRDVIAEVFRHSQPVFPNWTGSRRPENYWQVYPCSEQHYIAVHSDIP